MALLTAEEQSNELNADDGSEAEMNLAQGYHVTEEGHVIKRKGISWPLCALFLIGNMAGGGIVALPVAVQNTYFLPGVLLCFIVSLLAMYTCILLGECWVILQKRYPIYRSFCRQVYAEIGFRAMGPWAKQTVSVTIDITQFGACVIFLLLSAKGITEAITFLAGHQIVHYCWIILALAAIILPFTFAKSPEDFWPAIFGAMLCSVLSVVFIIVGSGLDYKACNPSANEMLQSFDHIKPFSTIAAIGTMLFAYGGHGSFTVIMHDMSKPKDFTKSTYLAYGGVSLVYVPMAIVSVLTYGGNIHSSIINSIQTPWIQQTVNWLIILHCLMAFLLILNPLNLDIEERLGAVHHFGWQRVAVRSVIMILITFVALSLPSFGPILDLIGASSNLLTVLIFPIIFYFYLNAAGNMQEEQAAKSQGQVADKNVEYPMPTFKQVLKYNDKKHLFFGFAVMALGVLVCLTASASAIADLASLNSETFELPCYVQAFRKSNVSTVLKPVFCCGLNKNISVRGVPCSTH